MASCKLRTHQNHPALCFGKREGICSAGGNRNVAGREGCTPKLQQGWSHQKQPILVFNFKIINVFRTLCVAGHTLWGWKGFELTEAAP